MNTPVLTEEFILPETTVSAEQSVKTRFVVFYKDMIIPVRIEHICCFRMSGRQLVLITRDNQTFALRKTIREVEACLNKLHFFRANRSEIIAFDYIQRIESYFGQRIVVYLEGQHKVIVSKSRIAAFLKWLGD